MARELMVFVSEDGKQHPTLAEAERYDEVRDLAAGLAKFDGEYEGDAFDAIGAAEWLLKTYTMEPN